MRRCVSAPALDDKNDGGMKKKKHAQTLFFFFFFSMRLSAPSIARRLTTSHTMASPPAYEALTAKLCQASALDVREK